MSMLLPHTHKVRLQAAYRSDCKYRFVYPDFKVVLLLISLPNKNRTCDLQLRRPKIKLLEGVMTSIKATIANALRCSGPFWQLIAAHSN